MYTYVAEYSTGQTMRVGGGIGFRFMELKTITAPDRGGAMEQAQAMAKQNKWRLEKLEARYLWHVTVRPRRGDQRRRPCYVVRASNERDAITNAYYQAKGQDYFDRKTGVVKVVQGVQV